jgi:Ca2+-binding EF-hand superfamily protein
MMDRSGIARGFQKTTAWVFPDSTGFISEADMEKNIAACDLVIDEVSTSEFRLYADKALTCVNGTMTKPENKMADAGEHIWAFYIYDSNKNGYKRIILNMTGDWSQENLATNSKEIVDWMMKIQ